MSALKARIGPVFGRREVRETAGAFPDRLLSGVERKTGWLLAEQAGLKHPARLQTLLGAVDGRRTGCAMRCTPEAWRLWAIRTASGARVWWDARREREGDGADDTARGDLRPVFDRPSSERSVEDQVDLCRAYWARERLSVVATYADRAKSGASILGRDGLIDLDGVSPREIAGALNGEGVPPPRGGSWTASTINGNHPAPTVSRSR